MAGRPLLHFTVRATGPRMEHDRLALDANSAGEHQSNRVMGTRRNRQRRHSLRLDAEGQQQRAIVLEFMNCVLVADYEIIRIMTELPRRMKPDRVAPRERLHVMRLRKPTDCNR